MVSLFMKYRPAVSLSIVLPLLLVGCDLLTDPKSAAQACSASANFGITVTVVDSSSGAPLGDGTTVRVQDGTYVDSIVRPSDTGPLSNVFGLAEERAGLYDVMVIRPSYRVWAASEIRVTRDACHVHTVELHARMVPGL